MNAFRNNLAMMNDAAEWAAGGLARTVTRGEATGLVGRRLSDPRIGFTGPLPHCRGSFPSSPGAFVPSSLRLHRSSRLRVSRRQRGFTFTEVLFAVILLGTGFIMLAGIFPVAIRQAQTSVEQTTAAAVAKLAVDVLRPLATVGILPVTGNEVRQLPVAVEQLIRRDRVLTQDRRTAWVALYRRRANTNYAELIILVARARGTDTFAYLPFVTGQQTGQALVEGVFYLDANGISTVTFTNEDGAAVEDGYVVVAGPDGTNAAFVGNVYRLGFRKSGDTWFLQPGAWYTASGTLRCPVFVFGRAGVPNDTTPNPFDAVPGSFSGASQAVGVYTTILPLR